MGRVYFTKKILADPVLFEKQLNLLARQHRNTRTVKVLEAQVANLRNNPVTVPGGGSSTVNNYYVVRGGLAFERVVAGAGVESFTMANMGSSSYAISCYVITADGAKAAAVPHIPPYTADSRTATSFDVEVFEAGTLYVSIIPVTPSTGFAISVSITGAPPNTQALTFPDLGTADYVVDGYVLTADGAMGIIRPKVPPYATDSRTSTQVDVEYFEEGTLYAWIVFE